MQSRNGIVFPLLAVVAASAITALAVLRMVMPTFAQWFTQVPPGILDRWIDPRVSAFLSLGVGVAGVVVGMFALAAARTGTRVPKGVGLAAALLSVGIVVLAPGGVIPSAGYTFAVVTVGLVVAAIVLLTFRRPVVGIIGIAGLAVLAFFAVRDLHAASFFPMFFAGFAAQLPFFGTTAAYLILAAALILWAIGDARPPHGRFAAGVLRHRKAITIVGAACALPYALARASWLTPWPQLGGSAKRFAAEPAMMLTGLLLGAGMLAGGLLTLGLIRPWGERFSPWLAVIGGRPVPVMLAVLPATVVAVLFSAGGVEFLFQAVEGELPLTEGLFTVALMFPFWLWGPLLALAAWGYAMHRADAEASALALDQAPAATQRPERTRQPSVPRRASR